MPSGLGRAIADASSEGLVVREEHGYPPVQEHGYRSARRPGAMARLRRFAYFSFSKLRVTARWFKHVLTFENWLPYVVRKVERRTGIKVELTALERRLPLFFIWPRVFLVLRNRPAEEAAAARAVPPGSEGDT